MLDTISLVSGAVGGIAATALYRLVAALFRRRPKIEAPPFNIGDEIELEFEHDTPPLFALSVHRGEDGGGFTVSVDNPPAKAADQLLALKHGATALRESARRWYLNQGCSEKAAAENAAILLSKATEATTEVEQ